MERFEQEQKTQGSNTSGLLAERTIGCEVAAPDLGEVLTVCENAEDAQLKAFNGSSPGSHLYPVIGYTHGQRTHLSFPASAGAILDIGHIDSANKTTHQKNIDTVWNRKPDTQHAAAIASYIADRVNTEQKYILPNTIVAGFNGVSAFVWKTRGALMGYVVIDSGAKLPVTDGQHRYIALQHIKQDSPDDTWLRVETEQYLVTLTLERDIQQAHQDFVDIGKTRPIEASVLRTWDQKDSHSRITKAVADESPLFMNRIDVMSNSLGRTVDIVLTMSQLSAVIAELLYGTSQKPRVRAASRGLRRDSAYTVALAKALDVLEFFAKNSERWKLCLDAAATPNFFELRQERLDFNSTGLQAICRAAHYVITDGSLTDESREEFLKRLAALDYRRRDAEGQINEDSPFYGNVLSQDGGILNKRSTVDAGAIALMDAIGYGASHRKSRADHVVPFVSAATEQPAAEQLPNAG